MCGGDPTFGFVLGFVRVQLPATCPTAPLCREHDREFLKYLLTSALCYHPFDLQVDNYGLVYEADHGFAFSPQSVEFFENSIVVVDPTDYPDVSLDA